MKRSMTWMASVVALLLLGLTACDNQNKGSDLDTNKYGYASFSISLPNASLKAGVGGVGGGVTYDGTLDERKVTKVLVGIYGTDGICIERLDLDIKTNDSGAYDGNDFVTPTGDATFTTKAKKIVKSKTPGATYKIVVFLNPTASVDGIVVKGRGLADLENSAKYNQDEVVSANGIMMSNAKGYVEMGMDALKGTAEAAETATDKPKINVERAVAKVFVNNSAPNPSGALSGATAEMKGWNLDVINKKMFYIRQMDKLADGADEATAADSIRFAAYAKDPNMTQMTADDEEFDYKDNTKGLSGTDLWTAGYTNDDFGHYVPENTMNADAQKNQVSTSVIFAIKILPSGFASETQYVTYKNVPYKMTEFLTKLEASKTTGDAANGMPGGFMEEVGGLVATDFGDVDITSGGQDGLAAKIAKGKSFKIGNIRFYSDAINYYTMPIRHFNNTQAPNTMQYGRYGIVRNNIYKLSVLSIKNFGDPVVPVIPDEPNDKTTGYLSMDVTILPWLIRESSYEL